MFPIRDHNPSTSTPLVTWALIAANVGIFLGYWQLFADQQALTLFFYRWGLVPAGAVENPLSFLTSTFLHGGILHLAGNMLFLYIFGDNLEDEMGHLPFLAFYLAGGIGASVMQYVADPASTVPVIGASGAIAAVMGGYLLMFPRARVDILVFLVIIIRIIPVRAWAVLALWFAIQLGQGWLTDPDSSGVAYWAHAGGFVIGIVLTVPVWLRRGGPVYWRRTDGRPPNPEARYGWRRTTVPRAGRR